MRKILLAVWIMSLSLLLMSCGNVSEAPDTDSNQNDQEQVTPSGSDAAEEGAVRALVEVFGKQLQKVSLLAPEEEVKESLEEHYGHFVTPERLAEWQKDPARAPGRLTSSPWPDHIDVHEIKKQSDEAYEVHGEIIELTSTEQATGGAAAKQAVTLKVVKAGDDWLIDDVLVAEEGSASADSIVYRNEDLGFQFSLPESWKGYTIVEEQWEGRAIDGTQAGEIIETGPVVSIRHPEWTAEEPRQDIPIMVLTLEQWGKLNQQTFSVGAAPTGPKELGRNDEYVFALPARYNFAFPKGHEEVEEILAGNPLQAVDLK